MADVEEGEDDYYDNQGSYGGTKKGNILPFWGNQATANLNPLILTNVQNSPYYKTTLVTIKVKLFRVLINLQSAGPPVFKLELHWLW